MDPSWIVLTIRPPAKNVTLVLVPFRGTRPYEYADLGPKEQEMGRMLRALLDGKLLQANTKLVVTSAALDQDEIKRLIGSNPQGSPDDRT